MDTPKEYIIKKHKLEIVMHEVLPNNFHPFLHLDTASRIIEEYAKLYHEREVKKLSKVGLIESDCDHYYADGLGTEICIHCRKSRDENDE